MIYEIMNRADASKATLEPIASTTAIISITDIGDKRNTFHQQTWLKAVLELQFLDLPEGSKGCITREQAQKISNFVIKWYPQVERFIVHCEYGQCRSAGVAAAISRAYEGHDSGIFNHPNYLPNRTCYEYVFSALNVFRRKAVDESVIPFTISVKNCGFGSGYSAREITDNFTATVQDDIAVNQQKGFPVARYDADKRQAYLESADGTREYVNG